MSLQGGQAAYIADMMANPASDPAAGPSEISQFYAGCKIFVTGGSGFMGKLLIEKLLRSCPDIDKMYMLIRGKKGKTSETRFKEHFEDILYERLKRERPGILSKVVMIEGDVSLLNLGLSAENREILRDSNIIFHGAATVRFDEKLRQAVNINIRGTKQMLLFAKEMPNLKAFVHISTAFSQCVVKFIEEKFYAAPIDSDKLLTVTEILDDAVLERMTPVLMGKWPNTYAFTKAVAEDSVRQYSKVLPVCVVRPSIVIATSKEPITGWINNLYGPTGVVFGAGVGLLRSLHCNKDCIADIIPADYVINNIVVAAWDIATSKSINPNSVDTLLTEEIDEPPIYNCVSSCTKPITWGQFMKLNEIHGIAVPSCMVMWYYCFTLNKQQWVHNIYIVLLHYLPALIIDTLAFLTGRKPMLFGAYKKIHKFSGVISYFSTQQWKFENNAVLRLWDKLNPADRIKFDFNLESLDWNNYFYHHVRGLRVYLIKDPLDTLEKGKAKYFKLKIAHYTLFTIVWILVFWAFVSFLRFLRFW
ncbi:fatty acyl-CoA reductase wat [Cephus cinctus]|uniref:Fatty acyl-CoA reductase n=1 Tax=Cephus cinctus TaxID=211228 RepID=A0AAJ7VXG6_CEPCN|nr:fatty acyl-CoA reductase wat [Cephus cinctus]XP_024936711.1 fatty acyl-CoA reductase wat [Cephus cinctus]